jgi:hypothetical protein
VRPLEKLACGRRVADRGRLVDDEHRGQVRRVGPVGEGFFQLPVDAQLFQGGRQPPHDPLGPWEAAVRGRAFLHRSLRPLDQADLTPPDGTDVDGFGNDCQGVCGA